VQQKIGGRRQKSDQRRGRGEAQIVDRLRDAHARVLRARFFARYFFGARRKRVEERGEVRVLMMFEKSKS
jgi:hypothetical protein